MKELQLSDVVPTGWCEGMTVEVAIDTAPFVVELQVSSGELELAVGARRYLKDVIKEIVTSKHA